MAPLLLITSSSSVEGEEGDRVVVHSRPARGWKWLTDVSPASVIGELKSNELSPSLVTVLVESVKSESGRDEHRITKKKYILNTCDKKTN
jgi:hypothetical protein